MLNYKKQKYFKLQSELFIQELMKEGEEKALNEFNSLILTQFKELVRGYVEALYRQEKGFKNDLAIAKIVDIILNHVQIKSVEELRTKGKVLILKLINLKEASDV